MALNMADRIAVRSVIVPRCTAIVVQLAAFYLGKGDANDKQKGWAREAIRTPNTYGEQVSWHVMNQAEFIEQGSSIDDATLQNAVEVAMKTHFIRESE